jgi:hypothetical protein
MISLLESQISIFVLFLTCVIRMTLLRFGRRDLGGDLDPASGRYSLVIRGRYGGVESH